MSTQFPVVSTRCPAIIELVLAGEALEQVRELFREYQRSLDVDLCFQDFESELATLPGDYQSPGGSLYRVLVDGRPAGCVGLRPVDARTGEMKRLYLRPVCRGLGLGRTLVRRLLDDARGCGYERVVLDTLPGMVEAQALYASLGFRDIAPYTHNPVPGARFMGLELSGR